LNDQVDEVEDGDTQPQTPDTDGSGREDNR
jgi:hypothetical protein